MYLCQSSIDHQYVRLLFYVGTYEHAVESMHLFARKHRYSASATYSCSSIGEGQMQEYNKGEMCGLGSRLRCDVNDLPLDCYLESSLLPLSVLQSAIFVRSINCEQKRGHMPH